jgi:hypothetical protein
MDVAVRTWPVDDGGGGDVMLKTLFGLVPLALGVAVFAVIIWFIRDRNMAIGNWLLAAFLVGHGWVHVMFVMPQPATATATADGVAYPFDTSQSWLVTNAGLDVGLIRPFVIALVVAVVIGFILAGLATVGLLVPEALWQGIILVASAASLLLLVVGLSPSLVIGYAIDIVLLWMVLALSWSPSVVSAA